MTSSELVKPRSFSGKLSAVERILFAKRLAVLLRAGVPILHSVRILKEQSTGTVSRRLLEVLHGDIERGQSLHSSLVAFRPVVGDLTLSFVRVGEVSGTLHESLDHLSVELQKQRDLRRKVVGSLVYPGVIVVATFGITLLLTTVVFPKIVPIIQSLHADVPWTTRALIVLSDFLVHYWLLAIGLVLLVVGSMPFVLRLAVVRRCVDRWVLSVPLVGELLRSYYLASICRTLSVLLKTDVRIVEAIRITAETISNTAYRACLTTVSESLARGGSLSSLSTVNKKLFPKVFAHMLSVGESTGSLGDTLFYLSQMYESDVEDLTKNLSTVLEPALMVFMGLLVGFVAISIITPIYGVTNSLHP